MSQVFDVLIKRTGLVLCAVVLLGPSGVRAAPNGLSARGKIYKVLPHLLDRKGRHSLAPSLYERDAYQAYLRTHPKRVGSLQFDVEWKAFGVEQKNLTLRVEIRGSRPLGGKPIVVEKSVRAHRWWRHWASLPLKKQQYQALGDLIAWRATLWEGHRLLAEQHSFLW